jgi:hypothetical protein
MKIKIKLATVLKVVFIKKIYLGITYSIKKILFFQINTIYKTIYNILK